MVVFIFGLLCNHIFDYRVAVLQSLVIHNDIHFDCIYPTSFPWTGCYIRSNFKQSKAYLNLEFSFLTGCLRLKNQSVPLFSHSWREKWWIHAFTWAALSGIWTLITISHVDNYCMRYPPFCLYNVLLENPGIFGIEEK